MARLIFPLSVNQKKNWCFFRSLRILNRKAHIDIYAEDSSPQANCAPLIYGHSSTFNNKCSTDFFEDKILQNYSQRTSYKQFCQRETLCYCTLSAQTNTHSFFFAITSPPLAPISCSLIITKRYCILSSIFTGTVLEFWKLFASTRKIQPG